MADVRDASPSGAASAPGAAGAPPAAGTPAAAPAAPPEGRYGRYGAAGGDDARADRKLKITGGVLGALLLAMVAWFGASYIAGEDVSGELIKYKVVSDSEVEAHLEVRKDAGVEGVCTLRARSADGAEVGRKDVPVAKGEARVDTVVPLRTTARSANAELVGCSATGRG